MKYRALFTDTFFDVEAESEEEAQQLALQKMRENLRAEDFIVWRDDERKPDQL